MKLKLLIITILLLSSIIVVSASKPNIVMTVKGVDKIYNPGDDISANVTILPNITMQAILSAELKCEEYDVKYFMQPIKLKDGKRLTVDITPIKTFENMEGTCIIDFYLKSMLDGALARTWTDAIKIIKEDDEENETKVKIIEDDKEKEPLIGSSCGTVSPDYRDECCENKGFDYWDLDELECKNFEEEAKSKKWVVFLFILIIAGVLFYFYRKYEPKIKGIIREIRMWGFR